MLAVSHHTCALYDAPPLHADLCCIAQLHRGPLGVLNLTFSQHEHATVHTHKGTAFVILYLAPVHVASQSVSMLTHTAARNLDGMMGETGTSSMLFAHDIDHDA